MRLARACLTKALECASRRLCIRCSGLAQAHRVRHPLQHTLQQTHCNTHCNTHYNCSVVSTNAQPSNATILCSNAKPSCLPHSFAFEASDAFASDAFAFVAFNGHRRCIRCNAYRALLWIYRALLWNSLHSTALHSLEKRLVTE